MAQEGQYPGSLWMPHQQRWTGRGGYRVLYIVVHGTATPGISTAQGIGQLFQSRRGSSQGGTHYVVGKDGTIVQGVREEDSAWGNGIISEGHDPWWKASNPNPNQISISIEHVKTTSDNHEALTYAQMASSFALIDYLCRKWGVPPRWADASGGITGHFSVDPINRRFCPGPYPWNELFAQLQKSSVYPVVSTVHAPLLAEGMPTDLQPTPLLSSPPVASNAAPGVVSSGARAHAVLSELPGFGGIVEAVDTGASFSAPQITSLGDVFGWLGVNGFALLLRLLLVLLGLAVIIGLFVALARGNDWIGTAGGDSVPFLLGQA